MLGSVAGWRDFPPRLCGRAPIALLFAARFDPRAIVVIAPLLKRENCEHIPQWDQPEAVTDAIADLFERTAWPK